MARYEHTAEKSISVIICASDLRRLPALIASVGAVQRQSRPAHELIVVIDHNQQMRQLAAKQLGDVTLLENTGRKGLSSARNTGVRAATADVVAFVDDDAIAHPDWLKSLAKAYSSQFVVGAGGPIVPQWPTDRPSWLPQEFDWTVGCSYAGENTQKGHIQNLIGCNMSFRRRALLMVGLFDEKLGRNGDNAAGGEESDLARRLLAAFPAAHLAYAPAASVRHIIEPHRTRFSYFVRRCWAEGKSKALLASGVARERSFVVSNLASAFFRHLGNLPGYKDNAGLKKAATIFAGTATAALGYGWSRLRGVKQHAIAVAYQPVHIVDIDLAEIGRADQSGILSGVDKNGNSHGAAFCVVREAGHLMQVDEVPLYGTPINAAELRAALDLPAAAPAPEAAATTSENSLSARVVIATRDRPEMLDKCLASVLAQNHPDFEVVVVDSASKGAETRQLIERKYSGRKGLHYVWESRPGLARAHNRGILNCTRDFVAFTDDDVIADPNWLKNLQAGLLTHPRSGAATGSILPAELETRAQYWTERHGAFLKGTKNRLFDLGENRPASPLFPFAAGMMGSGANMAFTLEALRSIGPFDEALGAGTPARGGDDLDAFLSVISAGFTLTYVPDALVWHHHRRSEEGMQRQAYGYGVGLGAFLTKAVMNHPGAALHFLRTLPAAVRHMFGPSAAKLDRLPEDYPKALIWQERFGILAGVRAYFVSRRAVGDKTDSSARPVLTGEPVWKGK